MFTQRLADVRARLLVLAVADDGMSTVEYAIGTIAAAFSGSTTSTGFGGASMGWGSGFVIVLLLGHAAKTSRLRRA